MHPAEPPRAMSEHFRVRVQESDIRSRRRRCLLDEVTGARPDIEMSPAEVLAITLNNGSHRTSPHRACHEPKDEWVVDGEHERVVAGLSLVRGIVALHIPSLALGSKYAHARFPFLAAPPGKTSHGARE